MLYFTYLYGKYSKLSDILERIIEFSELNRQERGEDKKLFAEESSSDERTIVIPIYREKFAWATCINIISPWRNQ